MIKRMALVTARDGISAEDFRAYYENVHAPLGKRLFPMFMDYKRNYIREISRRPDGAPSSTISAINEITFASEGDYRRYLALAARPEIRAELLADEDKFIKPNSLWGFVVDEVTTPR